MRLGLAIVSAQASEKEFYLRSFRHRGILIHVAGPPALEEIGEVVAELVDNLTMVVLVSPTFPRGTEATSIGLRQAAGNPSAFVDVSSALIDRGVAAIRCPRGMTPARTIAYTRDLALRLRVDKLVLCDPRGGLMRGKRRRSFLTARALERQIGSRRGQCAWSAAELREITRAASGEDPVSVNLTTPRGLALELFSYQGSGTLITAGEYCSVERLGVGDFAQALNLIRRGEREGFLLPREDDDKARLLLTGYGAWFEDNRLAGVASLETEAYTRSRVGEVRGLYTITRFKGEGVGSRILASLEAEARRQGLRALFACTSHARAAAFFERYGFERCEPDRVPAQK